MSESRKVSLAIAVSILLHLLLAGVLIVWGWIIPAREAAAMPELKTVEVILQALPMPTPKPAPLQIKAAPTPEPKLTRSVLDTEGLAASEKAPENAMIESDKNSVAASDRPATGSAPLPSQDGKTRPFEQFTNQQVSLGSGKAPGSPAKPVPTPAPARDARPEPSPAAVTRVEKPVPKPEKTKPALTLDSFEDDVKTDAKPTPMFTPTPLPKSQPNAYALGKPTPVPHLTSTPAPSAAPKTAAPSPAPVPPAREVAMLATKPEPRPERALPQPGYQAEREKTKIEGSISNRGRPGVDAVATPLGRYRKSIADAIGSRWYYYINQRMDLITVGDVHIKFVVNETGHVEDVRILSNTANDTFGEFCMRSVTEAKIPPLPPDVVAKLDNGRLEIEYHFTVYPQ